jgi:hypothetical protein
VTQGASSLHSLQTLQKFFGVGRLFRNTRHDDHKEDLYRYTVRKREEIMNVIVPFFDEHSLQTAKHKNFKLFVKGMRKIVKKKHLTTKGMIEIAEIVQQMNHRRDKSDIIKILRNQTSGLANRGIR